jgi:hypothetical protein
MATSKKTVTKAAAPKKTSIRKPRFDLSSLPKNIKKRWGQRPFAYSVSALVLTLAVIFALLFVFNKGLFLAGTINGKWVTSWQFYSKLTQANGDEVFDSLVRETLIKQEAAKEGITATEKQIDEKIKELEDRFGGKENFELALKQNNTSEEELKDQLSIQILVEKLLKDKIKITDGEVSKYKKENKEFVGEMSTAEIKDTLKSQKLNEAFNPWFEELKKKANITTYF